MRRRRKGRRVDGVLLLDKPAGVTSNRALQDARRLLEARKAGHTGTLDPFATGLLPLCFGQATRFGSGLIGAVKEYRAVARVGTATTTGDPEGEVTRVRAVAVPPADRLEQILAGFLGESLQVPPMYSALKQAGRRLHELARQGRSVERSPRPVHVDSLVLEDRDAQTFTLRVRCSAGTYVRVLVEDIAARFDAPAHTASLRRLAVGPFRLEQAITLEALDACPPPERASRLLPVEAALAELGAVELEAPAAGRFLQGQAADAGTSPGAAGSTVRVYGPGRRFLGVGALDVRGRTVPERVIDTSGRKRPGAEERGDGTGSGRAGRL